MKRSLLLAIILANALGGPRAAENQQRRPQTGDHQSSQTNKIVPPGGTVVNPTISRPCSQAEPCWTQQQPEEKPLPRLIRPEWVIVYVTVIYSILTGLMLIAIKKQADTMESQAADARTSAADAAVTTQATLVAIKRQADAMEKQHKSMRDRERARLSLIFPPEDPNFEHPLRIVVDEEPEMMIELTLAIHNDGGSKAFGVRAWASMTIQGKDSPFVPAEYRKDVPISDVIRRASLVFPEKIAVSSLMMSRQIDEVAQGNADFYVYGEISYRDVFGYPHVTPFRFLWDVDDWYQDGQRVFDSGWVNQSPPST